MLITRIMEKLFRLEPAHCENCEHLRLLLEQERMERNALINKIIAPRSEPAQSTAPQDYKPVHSRYTPFSVKRAQLEQADRILAEQHRADLKAKANAADTERIAKLEKELGVEEDASQVG